MNTHTYNLKRLFVATFLCIGISLSAQTLAEDTEIYVGANTIQDTPPNVVFMIDTSLSMRWDISYGGSDGKISDAEKGAYDPTKIYEGYCKKDRLYWNTGQDTTGTNGPQCWTNESNQYIDYTDVTSPFTCNAASSALSNASGSAGYYYGSGSGFAARYSGTPGSWGDLSTSDHTSKVECEDDWGNHGETAVSSLLYPATFTNGGPWRADSTNAISWGSGATSTRYTFYSANYLNWYYMDRYTVVMQTMRDVLDDMVANNQFIKLALMRFRGQTGGYFFMPMQQLDATNVADYKQAIFDIIPSDYTPLAETLYEAYRYYRGLSPDQASGHNVTGVESGGTYISPIEFQCQKNFVIILTDGIPSSDGDRDSSIKTADGVSSCNDAYGSSCLDEMAHALYNTDCSTGTGSLDGTQNVMTHTIGFKVDDALLSATASNGGGKYKTADNAAQLSSAITAVFNEVLAINSTFTAPAVSVNAYKRSYHNDELYFALFIPDEEGLPLWSGNIKRYRSASNGIYDNSTTPVLAIDPNTGFTYNYARSWWTTDADAPDGAEVAKGGAASLLNDYVNRNVYTFVGTLSSETTLSTGHDLATTNTNITETVLGDATMTNKDDLINWARGKDLKDVDGDGVYDEARRQMADPLHAQPVLIPYAATASAQDITLYAATNEGYLHAIDPDDGTELWAFMPQELLPNIKKLYDNSGSTPHPYGLDGPLTYWHKDLDNDGVPYTAGVLDSGEFVYLYQGMRRGGSTNGSSNDYYSLNVTNRSTPKLRWQLNNNSTGFAELGQTWSAMKKAKVKVSGTVRDVVIFGGGYDTNQDTTVPNDGSGNQIFDQMGRAIYIADASTGAIVWSGSPANSSTTNKQFTNMIYSIPSDVTILNMDNDNEGLADRIYVGDMGGRVWRFDIDNSQTTTTAANFVTGGIIASLGDNTTEANARRFYYAPEVALSKDRKNLYIAIGSGYRSHPLNETIHEAMYIIRDPYVYEVPPHAAGAAVAYNYVDSDTDGFIESTDAVITTSNLFDATDHTIGNTATSSGALDTALNNLANAKGCYINLNDVADNSWKGEKVTGKATAISNTLYYTTFTPVQAVSQTNCAPSQGKSLLYHINLNNCSAVSDYQGNDGNITRDDRVVDEIKGGGLPPSPQLIYHEDGSITVSVGLTQKDTEFTMSPQKYKWMIE